MSTLPEFTLQKKQLRNHYQSVLSAIEFPDLIEKSAHLSHRFFDFVSNHSGRFQHQYLVSFCPFGNEPQVNVERESRDEPYRVAYVRIESWNERKMTPREARRDTPDLWEEFELKSGDRIFQPKDTQVFCKPDEISVILVPGLVFTEQGMRLGRGAGFYDRFLKAYPKALRVGIAFQNQIASKIPEASWDERVDIVLTDQSLYTTKNYGQWKIHGKIENRNPL